MQSVCWTVHCTLSKCVRVFVAAVPATPQSDPQYLESAAFKPAFLPQPRMETGCTGLCVHVHSRYEKVYRVPLVMKFLEGLGN